MVQFAASNIKLTCLQNGADFLSDDDIYMNVNGFKFGFGFGSSLQQAPGFANNTRPGAKEMRTGDTATLDPITGTTTIGSVFYLPDGKFSPNAKSIDIIPFSNNIKMRNLSTLFLSVTISALMFLMRMQVFLKEEMISLGQLLTLLKGLNR